MTNLEKKAKAALLAWVRKKHGDATSVSHIHPRAYVIGRPALCCLIVAYPPHDREPQLKAVCPDDDCTHSIRDFDSSIRIGDWVTVGYVCRTGCQETIAIPAVPRS
jgi:hypothetical protein